MRELVSPIMAGNTLILLGYGDHFFGYDSKMVNVYGGYHGISFLS